MAERIIITESYCSHEDSGGDYFVVPITDDLVEYVHQCHQFVQTATPEVTEITFEWSDMNLVEYDDGIDSLFESVNKNCYKILTNCPQKIIDIPKLHIDLTQISFLPCSVFKNSFRFSCHIKNTSIKLTSPMIEIKHIEKP